MEEVIANRWGRDMRPVALVLLLIPALVQPAPAAETMDKYLKEARTALEQGKTDRALELVNKAIDLEGKSAQAFFLRGVILSSLRRPKEAIEDFSKTIKLDANAADAFDRRGSEHFKLGHFKDSIADFDRFLELRPKEEPGHWRHVKVEPRREFLARAPDLRDDWVFPHSIILP